jgi:ERCC4-type nuclease
MSGAESLIPFIREKGKNQPTIIIDSREAKTAPKIVKGLKELGADISIRYLEKGDYVISNLCAFERKTVSTLFTL